MSDKAVIPAVPLESAEPGRTWTASLELHGLTGTKLFGKMIAASARPGLRIGLSGSLGAGKTELVRHVSVALGASSEHVSSPSYVLESIYPLPARDPNSPVLDSVRHWDWYRLRGGELPPEIMDDRVSARSLILVEWSDRCPDWDDIEDIHCELLQVTGQPDWRLANLTVRDDEAAKVIREQLLLF